MDLDDVFQPNAARSTALGSRSVNPGRRIRRAALAATVLAAGLLGLADAALAQTTTDQRFQVISAGPPGAKRIVVANGVIRGVGTEVITSNPDDAVTLVWTFPEGELFVTATYTIENVLDPRSCIRTLTLTGTWEITGGTGEFSAATGGGEFSGTNRIHLNRTAEGCAGPPRVLRQVFTFTGDVSLAGAAAA